MLRSQLGAEAVAAKAKEGRAEEAAAAVSAIARLAAQISHEQLQARAAQVALEALQIYETQAQICCNLFVDALRSNEATPELAADAAWTLNKLTQQCMVTRQWVVNSSGVDAVQRALLKHSTNNHLVHCCVGIVYNLDGLRGLGALLSGCVTGGSEQKLCDTVISVIIWSVDDIVKQGSGAENAAYVLQVILQLLGQYRVRDREVQNACCSALSIMVREDARLGALLVELGGVPLLLEVLRNSMSLNGDGNVIARSCVDILVSIVQASAMLAEVIRQHGGVQVLAEYCMRGTEDSSEESAIWALGHLAGLGTVLEAMTHAPDRPAVIRGGLDAIAELASTVATESEVKRLPEVLRYLWMLLEGLGAPDTRLKRCRKRCLAAICSAMLGLATHADPGQVAELDEVVKRLLHWQPKDFGCQVEIDIAQNIVESIGRLVLLKPLWRDYCKQRGADDVFARMIRLSGQHRRLLKFSFWAAAALSGLPFVYNELQLHLRSADTIDAAFCTIIDILDDDLEGDWVLKGAERCSQHAVPSVLKLIADAMQGYVGDSCLQSRGCHCIGLLAMLAPPGFAPMEAIAAIFSAARRHPSSARVVRDALYAFHCLLEPGVGAGAAKAEARASVINTLKEGGAEAIAGQAVKDHADSGKHELLEEAMVVICCLSGVKAALDALVEAKTGPVCTVGVKAIAEFGRHQPSLLRESAGDILATVKAMALDNKDDDVLQQNANLLIGFCNSVLDVRS